MKVRTIDELQNKLDTEIAWRKKELIDYKFVVESCGIIFYELQKNNFVGYNF